MKNKDGAAIMANIELDKNINNLYACTERSIASDSLLFIMDALLQVKTEAKQLIPKERAHEYDNFYRLTVAPMKELRDVIYYGLFDEIIPVYFPLYILIVEQTTCSTD